MLSAIFTIPSNLHNGHLSTAVISFGVQSIYSLLFQPLYNGHLSTMATFFCAQFRRCREVQLYSFGFVLFLCVSQTLLMLDPLWQATELQGQNNSRFVVIPVFSDKE